MRYSTHGKGHEEGGSALHKGKSEPQETPLFPSIYPQNQSLFYALTYTSDFTGDCSPITISLGEGVNLQLQLIKIPGRDKSFHLRTLEVLWPA